MNKPTRIADSEIDPTAYLDYIDKEMTLCGIITTFSLACVLFMADKMFDSFKTSSDRGHIDFKSVYFLLAICCFVTAALLLFKLRANLAHHYGQISLRLASKDPTKSPVEFWIEQVDDWKFWRLYFYGIALIIGGFVEVAMFLYFNLYQSLSSCVIINLCIGLIIIIFSLFGGYGTYLYNKKIYK